MIAESTYETNENVKKLVGETEEANDSRGGLFGNLGSKIGGLGTLLLGAGGFGLISGGLNMLGKTLLAPFKAVSALVSKIPGIAKTSKAPIKTSAKGVPIAEKKPAKVKSSTAKLVKDNVNLTFDYSRYAFAKYVEIGTIGLIKADELKSKKIYRNCLKGRNHNVLD